MHTIDSLPLTPDELEALQPALRTLSTYTSLPGQRARAARLAKHAAHGPLILTALRRARYREGALDSFLVGEQLFWGLVLIALLDPATRSALLDDVSGGAYDLPFRDKHLTLLHFTAQAALPLAAGDADFAQRAEALKRLADARRDASEATRWARALGLTISDADGWRVAIYIPQGGNRIPTMRPTLLLDVCALPDFPWHLSFEDAAGARHFSQRPGSPPRDDFGVAPLALLADFPAWFRALSDGLDFHLEHAQVLATGVRGAKARVLAWLRMTGVTPLH